MMVADVTPAETPAQASSDSYRMPPQYVRDAEVLMGNPFTLVASGKVLRLARVQNLARKLFSTNEAITRWLCKPEPALGNRAPLELLDTDRGGRQVETVLRSLAHGQFL